MNNMPPVPSNFTNDEVLAHIYQHARDLPQPITLALDRFAGLIDENLELNKQAALLQKEIEQLRS